MVNDLVGGSGMGRGGAL